MTAKAVTRATATAQAEATRQAMPTPRSWAASAGFWTPEPAADLVHWSSAPTLAGEPITVGNAPNVEALGRWGKGRGTALAWSPDGRWLAVGTSTGVYLHARTLAEVRSLATT